MKRFYKEMRPELTRRPHLCSFICYALFRAATCVRFQKSNSFRSVVIYLILFILNLVFFVFVETFEIEKADDTFRIGHF